MHIRGVALALISSGRTLSTAPGGPLLQPEGSETSTAAPVYMSLDSQAGC